jgi:hypothetical protein
MPGPWCCTLTIILSLVAGDNVLITLKGEKYEGPVSRSGTDYVVQTLSGPRRIPEAEVGIVFENLRDVTQRADDRYREAKRLYEEASKLDESDPARNQKLSLAVEVALGAVSTYQLLQPHYTGASFAAIPNSIQVMMQFVRLCRGAATSDIAGPAPGEKPGVIVLDEPAFRFSPPPAADRPWVLADDLGSGLVAAAHDLGNPLPERRLEAVQRLTHPPSPLHLSALLKLLESEREVAVVRAISEGLGLMDSAVVLKSLAWAKKETDPAKRGIAFSILRSSGDRAAFDFLVDWFEETPPATHADRAAFAGGFRPFHALAVPQLKELLAKNRNPKLQIEVIRQLGMIGDKSAGPTLLKTMGSYPKDSAVSLLKLGKPALPTIFDGAHSHEPEIHRICLFFCRKLTGVPQQNLTHFETWWAMNRKTVQEEEKTWWEDQARKGWIVDPREFAMYDLPMESIVP